VRGKRAKAIRRELYGDYAHQIRQYVRNEKGTIYNSPGSNRRKYLNAKEEYKNAISKRTRM